MLLFDVECECRVQCKGVACFSCVSPPFDCVLSRTCHCLHLTCHSYTTGVMKAMICQHQGGMGHSQCWRVFVHVLPAMQSIEMVSVGRATMGDHAAVIVMVMMVVVVLSSLTCTSDR